ncbi:MAG TPA: type II secretion system protein [Candidatus Saccharimonadaceae bacterium]|nr:type II secretion system protein [Candidatus Saccharimonadaceae bacterium]
MTKSKSGFTLVELMIVIVVIGILAAITLVVYSGAQAQARDARRIADVHSIAEAIGLYDQKYGNSVQGGSGCGSSGSGNGWFNFVSSASGYNASILSCLQNAGYLNGASATNTGFVDPTGCTTSSGSAAGSPLGHCTAINGQYYTYMKYTSGGSNPVTCVYARLETQDDTSTLMSSSNPCSTAASATVAQYYHMNYEVVVQ